MCNVRALRSAIHYCRGAATAAAVANERHPGGVVTRKSACLVIRSLHGGGRHVVICVVGRIQRTQQLS